MKPRDGDLLVSRGVASLTHEVTVVPATSGTMCATHDEAVQRAHELAKTQQVDAWLTEDHTHFLRLASFRIEP